MKAFDFLATRVVILSVEARVAKRTNTYTAYYGAQD